MNKKLRDEVYKKYDGLCAYSGTPLEDDWQVDHIVSKREWTNNVYYQYGTLEKINKALKEVDNIDNLVPCQRIINHYKRALRLETFRNVWLGELHKRLAKLPKNPKVERSIKRKEYLLKVASYFDITPEKPFDKIFYFEKHTPFIPTIGGI